LIEDEAHRCIKNYDYTYVAREYIKDSKSCRIVGLTASPGSEISKINEICENLGIDVVEIRTRESEDVKPYLKKLEIEIVKIELNKDFLEIRELLKKLLQDYVEDLRKRHLLFGPATKTNIVKLQKKLFLMVSTGNKKYNFLLGLKSCASALKIFHAIELLETQTLHGLNNYLKELFRQANKKENKSVISLVKKPEFNKVFIKTNELLTKNFEHPKLEKIKEIVESEFKKNKEGKILIFTNFRETANLISSELNKITGVNSKIFIGQTRKEKNGLSQEQQKKIIEEFSTKKINVLCATSIGEEGLDIPEVDIVIFYEPVPSAIRSIQRSGRTARLKEGKLIILITKKTRDEANFYTSKIKEKRMFSAINKIKEKETMIKEVQKKLDFYSR
jgi:Fanconi anemia group M protein